MYTKNLNSGEPVIISSLSSISSLDEFLNASIPMLMCREDFSIDCVNKAFEEQYALLFEKGTHLDEIFIPKNSADLLSTLLTKERIIIRNMQIPGLNTSGFYKFQALDHSLPETGTMIFFFEEASQDVEHTRKMYREFFNITNSLPIPVIVSDFKREIFINSEGEELINAVFGSVEIFKLEIVNRDGLYKKIAEQNGFFEKFTLVRETGEAIRNIFITIEAGSSDEIVLLMNISIIEDHFTGEAIGFLTTLENITEVLSLNQELHYSLLNLRGVIEAFARDRIAYLLAYGEEETAKHMIEVRVFSELIADTIMKDNTIPNKGILEYSKITPIYIKMLGLSAILHDFGKVEPRIHELINLPRQLTGPEYDKVKTHTRIGANLIGNDNDILRMCWLVALYHHERWDGSGYPEGLLGRDIPLSARIVAFADMYSALKNERAYKDSISDTGELLKILDKCESFFDPVVFRVGMALIPEMEHRSQQIEEEFKDFEMTSEEVIRLITDVFSAIMMSYRA
ncbi:MAG: HD domain-containing protein [bacterium]|nr:HD domain-containing protein [bacterium]